MSSAGPEIPVAAILLAAGRSRRMGGRNKLLEDIGGEPMVMRVLTRLLEVGADPVVVVTGHDAEPIRRIVGTRARVVWNPDYEEGIAASLRTGITQLDPTVRGALVCLGDMPNVSVSTLLHLIEAFRRQPEVMAVVPVSEGQRGNPVLWSSDFFGALSELRGDTGARQLLSARPHSVRDVDVDDPGVLLDVDTPEALAEVRGKGGPADA